MTMKSVDLPHLRSVVLAGHAGAGKTTLAEQLLFRAGAIPRLGRVDDGTAHLDFEPEEQKRSESLSLAVGTFESDGTRISLVDTPGYPDFIADVIEGFAASRRRDLRHGRLGRRGGRAREGGAPWAAGPNTAACFFINKSDRENADPTAALDALRASFGDKIAPLQLAIGAAESLRGLRRPRPPQGLALGRYDRGGDPDPGRPRGRGRAAARPAARGRRRGRRRRPDQVPRGRGDRRPGARGVPAQGRQGIDPRAGARRQRGQGHRPARAARRDRALPALPRRRAAGPADRQGRRDRRGRGRRERPAARPRVQDDRRPVRRPADLPARPVRDAPFAGARLEQHPERGRADRPAAAAPRQGTGADRRAEGRRDRRGRQAGRDRDRRHAVAAREAARRCRRSSSRSRR